MEIDARGFTNCSDTVSAYIYLLQWDWPEHIESILRKLVCVRLNEIGDADAADGQELYDTDYLGARLVWLISVYPKSNPVVLHALAQQQQPAAYLERIAENPNVLPETLEILSDHRSTNVRVAVAENTKTPPETLDKLVHDESVDVRYAMAENANLSQDLLGALADDENAYVAARARRSLNQAMPVQPAVLPLRYRNDSASSSTRRRSARG